MKGRKERQKIVAVIILLMPSLSSLSVLGTNGEKGPCNSLKGQTFFGVQGKVLYGKALVLARKQGK